MVQRKNQQTRHYCKSCKIWIADNKAQRDQHERGARHKAASEAMLEDIARKNKAKALAEASSRAEIARIEAKAAVAMGYSQRSSFSFASERAVLLDSIALATTAKSLPTVGHANGDESGDLVGSRNNDPSMDAADPRGYGKWEEVVDVQRIEEPKEEEIGRSQKRCHEGDFIGAEDATEKEEAALRFTNAGDSSTIPSASTTCVGTEDTTIQFKARNLDRTKRRRRAE